LRLCRQGAKSFQESKALYGFDSVGSRSSLVFKNQIEDRGNLETIQEWVDDDEEDEIFGDIVKKLKVDIYTLTQAANMLEDMKRLLAQVKAKVGGGDKRYLKISSACAHHILGFLIDTVNSAQDTFDKPETLRIFSQRSVGLLV